MHYFRTTFLEEANRFISGLHIKQLKKYYTTLTLLNKQMTQNFLKNFPMTFGNLGANTMGFKFDF